MTIDNKQTILEEIIKKCRSSIKEVSKDDIEELQKQLKILEQIVSNTAEPQYEKSKEYWAHAKMGSSYFFRALGTEGIGNSYIKAFEAITKILDILRGKSLTITIQKVQRNSKGEIVNITTYKGKESKLVTKFNTKYNQVEYDLKESLKNLEIIQNADEAYINHYSNFYNMANEHIKSKRSKSSSTGWRKKINEGNIVEAYQRHLKMKHGESIISSLEDFTPQEVIILLYYSIGNVPWWRQGDIGYNQIKLSNNFRLAFASSIRRVATKILDMFSNFENFNIEDFNEIFTAQDQDQLVDISKLEENEIQNLMKEIKQTNRFKNLGKI